MGFGEVNIPAIILGFVAFGVTFFIVTAISPILNVVLGFLDGFTRTVMYIMMYLTIAVVLFLYPYKVMMSKKPSI